MYAVCMYVRMCMCSYVCMNVCRLYVYVYVRTYVCCMLGTVERETKGKWCLRLLGEVSEQHTGS